VFLRTSLLRRSLNYRSLAAGQAYPAVLRHPVCRPARGLHSGRHDGQAGGIRVVAADRSHAGLTMATQGDLEQQGVVFPKLFRRLSESWPSSSRVALRGCCRGWPPARSRSLTCRRATSPTSTMSSLWRATRCGCCGDRRSWCLSALRLTARPWCHGFASSRLNCRHRRAVGRSDPLQPGLRCSASVLAGYDFSRALNFAAYGRWRAGKRRGCTAVSPSSPTRNVLGPTATPGLTLPGVQQRGAHYFGGLRSPVTCRNPGPHSGSGRTHGKDGLAKFHSAAPQPQRTRRTPARPAKTLTRCPPTAVGQWGCHQPKAGEDGRSEDPDLPDPAGLGQRDQPSGLEWCAARPSRSGARPAHERPGWLPELPTWWPGRER
jgi:hypothetical protein